MGQPDTEETIWVGTQGWRQFLASKQHMLNEYDVAVRYTEDRPLQVEHGNVAEAAFRKWLAGFLPARYGVTSGYILKPYEDDAKRYHFDVIIYDKIESPVIWIEESDDKSVLGMSRALPLENVLGVIEVKAALTEKAAKDAVKKIQTLDELPHMPDNWMVAADPHCLPLQFFSYIVFFELRPKDLAKPKRMDPGGILESLLPDHEMKGYMGATVLRGSDQRIDDDFAMRVQVGWPNDLSDVTWRKKESVLTPETRVYDPRIKWDDRSIYVRSGWHMANFALFAFDVIAFLNGTYRSGQVSSFYVLPLGRIAKPEPLAKPVKPPKTKKKTAAKQAI